MSFVIMIYYLRLNKIEVFLLIIYFIGFLIKGWLIIKCSRKMRMDEIIVVCI